MNLNQTLMIIGLCAAALFVPCAPADAHMDTDTDTPLTLNSFSTNFLGVFQPAGGEIYSFEANWTPNLPLGSGFTLRGELGAGPLKNVFGDHFLSVHGEVFGGYELIAPVTIEAGGGVQIWFGNGGSHPLASTDVVVSLPSFINRVFVGFSYFFLPGAPAKEWKIGIGITL